MQATVWNALLAVASPWILPPHPHRQLFEMLFSLLAEVECVGTVRVFGRNLHSRMPLDPTHVRLKRTRV
jgi:hypothetical protein